MIDLTHPDDIPFVIKAEQMVIEKMLEIDLDYQLFTKASYCFRMKTANGNYELFHHQAIPTLEDENGYLIQSINIHTNIHRDCQIKRLKSITLGDCKKRKNRSSVISDSEIITTI